MKGDFSRFSFDRKKRYSAVLMQQGRLQLDSDWNEQVQISEHRNTALFRDLVGRSGTPKGKAMELKLEGGALSLTPGVFYIDGLFVENDEAVVLEMPTTDGEFLYYVDSWTREVGASEDGKLVDPAVGLETTTRLKTEWRLRCQPLPGMQTEEWKKAFQAGCWPEAAASDLPSGLDAVHWWRPLSTGWMKLGAETVKLRDNCLCRIEVHEGSPKVLFKWSQSNASACAEVTAEGDNAYRLTDNYLHMQDAFKEPTWIELCAPGEATGFLFKAQLENGVLALDEACPEELKGLSKALIRRWDGVFSEEEKENSLESALGLAVEYDASGFYRSGDYWLLLIREGKIENWVPGEPKQPEGVEHHFAALGVLRRTGTNLVLEHLRMLFNPLANPNLSTQAQAEAGTDNTRLMTPLTVAQYTTARLATQAEAEAGTDNHKLMTPLRTAQHVMAKIAFDEATESKPGIIKLATWMDVLSGSLAALAVRPKHMQDYLDTMFVGMLGDFSGTNPPPVWIPLEGQLISRAERPKLWQFAQGSGNIVDDGAWASNRGKYSTGDGSTTFRVMDLRGEFRRSLDNGRGVDPGRLIGSWQADEFRSHTHQAYNGYGGTANSPGFQGGISYQLNVPSGATGGTETRSRNYAYPTHVYAGMPA